MPYPSTFSSFNRPTASDRLNSPSHSALHNSTSSAVGQVEQYIGLSTSSAVGSLTYDIRSPDSTGGGHIQGAAFGGTGQTTFAKGTLLVATSASVISKLAVGLDGQQLIANSSVAAGMNWGVAPGSKLQNITSVNTIIWNNSFSNTSLASVVIPGSTLGTNGAVRLTSFVNNYYTAGGGVSSILIRGTYGGATVSSVMIRSSGNTPAGSIAGTISFTLMGYNSTSQQKGFMSVNLNNPMKDNWSSALPSNSVFGVNNQSIGVSSIESTAPRSFGINAYGGSSDELALTIDATIVEKIV